MSRDRKRDGLRQAQSPFFQNWREGLEHLPVAPLLRWRGDVKQRKYGLQRLC